MKKHLIYFTVVLFYASCSDNNADNTGKTPLDQAKPIELRSSLVAKIEQDNTFSFDLFKQAYQTEKNDNIFLSPLSISMALSMTLNGANGETQEEMKNALRISGFSIEDINDYCKSLREGLLKVDPTTELFIANSIWYRQGFTVENSFLQVNRDYFNAEINERNFSSPATLKEINQWCADNTKNKITEILDNISGDAVMYLINAIYFKGIWQSEFDKKQTSDDTFYNEDGIKRLVKMMKQSGEFNYYEDNFTRYLTLPYGNEAFSMRILLPTEGKNIEDVINNLNNESWNKSMILGKSKINLQMPRFTAECKYDLEKKILPAMGMNLPFSSLADFSGISKNSNLLISKVTHKTYLSVDEKGTEAAAVTSVEVELTAYPNPQKPIDYIINKPFIFVIQENSTGAILFIGTIKNL